MKLIVGTFTAKPGRRPECRSLQIVGKPFGEEAVLAMARQVEQLYPIGRPTLANIA
jgi:hypothetical protein